MVTLLTKDEVSEQLDMGTAIDVVEEAFRDQQHSIVPDRMQLKQSDPDGEMFVLSGVVSSIDVFGHKTVSVYPDNDERGLPRTLGAISLYDNDTGALTAVMDGTHITNYRTGAIGAVAARHLAPADVETIGIVGASTVGRHQALALDTELAPKTIRMYSRSAMKHEAVRELQDRVTADVVAAESAAAACADAGIIVAATTSPTPVFPTEAVREDALVVGVGSNDPSMRELPGGVMERAEYVYVDDYDRCLTVGDIADAIDEGRLTKEAVVPIGELLTAPSPPDQTGGVAVVKSVGSILLDIHVGSSVLERAEREGLGQMVDLQGLE